MGGDKSTLPTMLAAAAGTAAVAAALLISKKKKRKDAESSSRTTPPPSKPIVYGFMPLDSYADSSPACLKLLTFLKMCNVDFDVRYFKDHEMKNSTRTKKMPYIHWDRINDGMIMGDSTLIVNGLVRTDPGTFDLDDHLTPEQVAIGIAFKTMLEESMYFYGTYVRWVTSQFDEVTVPTYFADIPLPPPFKGMLIKRIRGKMIRDVKGHGVALLDDAEVVAKFRMELGAVSDYLGSKKYFMGDKVSSFDATVFGFVALFAQGEWEHEIIVAARNCKNLMAYVERMKREFWPEAEV